MAAWGFALFAPAEACSSRRPSTIRACSSVFAVCRNRSLRQRIEMRYGGENRGAPLGGRHEAGWTALTAAPLGKRRPVGGVPARAGLIGLDFLNIHDQVSAVTTSVLCDRAGKGWSEDV